MTSKLERRAIARLAIELGAEVVLRRGPSTSIRQWQDEVSRYVNGIPDTAPCTHQPCGNQFYTRDDLGAPWCKDHYGADTPSYQPPDDQGSMF